MCAHSRGEGRETPTETPLKNTEPQPPLLSHEPPPVIHGTQSATSEDSHLLGPTGPRKSLRPWTTTRTKEGVECKEGTLGELERGYRETQGGRPRLTTTGSRCRSRTDRSVGSQERPVSESIFRGSLSVVCPRRVRQREGQESIVEGGRAEAVPLSRLSLIRRRGAPGAVVEEQAGVSGCSMESVQVECPSTSRGPARDPEPDGAGSVLARHQRGPEEERKEGG